MKQVAGMSAEEAAIFLRPLPKRYKPHATKKVKILIVSLVRQANADATSLRVPLDGLYLRLAFPEARSPVTRRFSDEWQGARCCALSGNRLTSGKRRLNDSGR